MVAYDLTYIFYILSPSKPARGSGASEEINICLCAGMNKDRFLAP